MTAHAKNVEKGKKHKKLYPNPSTFKKASNALRGLDHKLRQQIFDYITEKGLCSVTEISRKFRLEQSVTSQHLGIMRRAGYVVVAQRKWKYYFYSISPEKVNDLAYCLFEFFKREEVEAQD